MKLQLAPLSVAVVTALLLVQNVHAHLVLTFPPARDPKYDYLDNYRKGGPCGIPDDPNGHVTTLQAGSTFNLTYYLSYPHRGGIRVNLLDSMGHVIYALLGLQETFVNSEDITLEHHEIVLPPDFECERCVLQGVRQAAEFTWTDAVFWSCADISIVNSSNAVCDNMTCSGHGTCVNGRCICDRLYSGDICQNEDECEDESDCSGHGSCIDLKTSWYPSKQCFCNSGWFGDNCARISLLTSATISPAEYALRRELHPKLTMYAKIDGNELEVALVLNGISYVGLGWKPMDAGLNSSCNSEIPKYLPPGTHPLWPLPLSFPMVPGADTFYNQLAGINSSYVPISDEHGKGGSSGFLHPMDCTDIIIGMARGDQFRVFDYYTRDRGQPWRDNFYNGQESVTAAVGLEENGFTYIKWRRPLTTGDSVADYDIENKNTTLIWAFGQVYPDYSHWRLSEDEFNKTQNQRFFPVDQLKYHGNKNRGVTSINFFEADSDESVAMATASSYAILLLCALVSTLFRSF